MSHTVVLDNNEIAKQTENRLNAVIRHCRIGRVTRKMQVHGGKWVVPPSQVHREITSLRESVLNYTGEWKLDHARS